MQKVCGGLEIEGVEGKTKRQLIRLILDHLESDTVTKSEDNGMTILLTLRNLIKEMIQETKDDDADAAKKKEIEALQEAYKKEIAELEKEFKLQMEKFGSITKKEDVTGTPTQLF